MPDNPAFFIHLKKQSNMKKYTASYLALGIGLILLFAGITYGSIYFYIIATIFIIGGIIKRIYS